MIQIRSVINLADNSGIKRLRVFHVHVGSHHKFGRIGDLVTASVLTAIPESDFKKGDKVKAVIVRTRKEFRRSDGTWVKFDQNAAVVLENIASKVPVATRIFGPIPREIKELGYQKIASLAKEIV